MLNNAGKKSKYQFTELLLFVPVQQVEEVTNTQEDQDDMEVRVGTNLELNDKKG